MRALKVLIPVLMIAVSLLVAKVIVDNPPAAKPRPAAPSRPLPVDAIPLKTESWTVIINSYGTVEAATETSLIPQVAGTVTEVSPDFENGGFIRKGDLILTIDPADYRIAVKTAQASLAQARATLSEQQSLSEQAIRDWKRLGRSGEPSDLVAQKPQLDAARAQVASAQAQLEKARLDLARTEIRAPYNGRIRDKAVSIGQYVSPGIVLSGFYSTDAVRLRLPLAQTDLDWLAIPDGRHSTGSTVEFANNGKRQWLGKITRSEGVLDARTRQLYVTAEIDQPFSGNSPVILGQFLNARILGHSFDDVFVVPTSLVRSGDSVLLADDGKISTHVVDVLWRDEKNTIIGGGLTENSLLVTTTLGDEVDGLKVRVSVNGMQLKPDKKNRALAEIDNADQGKTRQPAGDQGDKAL